MYEKGSDNLTEVLHLRYNMLLQLIKICLYTQGQTSILFPFPIGKISLADIVRQTGGNIEETIRLLGGAIKANSIPAESLFIVPLCDVIGTTSIPDNILRTNGGLNYDAEVGLEGNVSFYSYITEENSAGGLTYTINTTYYIIDGKTVIIGGDNGSK